MGGKALCFLMWWKSEILFSRKGVIETSHDVISTVVFSSFLVVFLIDSRVVCATFVFSCFVALFFLRHCVCDFHSFFSNK